MPLLPDEARLLFLASRPDAVCGETYFAALAASRPNWRAVGALAEREKLLPVLWKYMQEHAGFIPADVREKFRAQALITDFRMAMTERTLHKVVEELSGQGIRVMLLKGAALAATVYPSFAQRPMGDLDILVAPDEAERAWRQLREKGWTLEYEGGERFYQGYHHLPALVDPSGLKLVLEIHRSIVPLQGPFQLDAEELWREARPVRLGATTVWVPSDRHQLLHLSIHFAWFHMFTGVGRTVRDVATLLAAGPFEWGRFTDLAVRTRARTCAYWTLLITRTLTGAHIPDEVMSVLRPARSGVMLRVLERAYITTGLFGSCPSIRVAKLLWSAGIQPRASGHGEARPWQVGDLFQEVFRPDPTHGLRQRLKRQLRAGAKWWQFARVLTSQRRVL